MRTLLHSFTLSLSLCVCVSLSLAQWRQVGSRAPVSTVFVIFVAAARRRPRVDPTALDGVVEDDEDEGDCGRRVLARAGAFS